MMWRWMEWIVAALLGVVIVSDAILILYARSLANNTHSLAVDPLCRPGLGNEPGIPFEGYTASAERLKCLSRFQGIWAVRYTSKSCGYCALDLEWDQLALQMESAGWPVIILVPKAAEEIAKEGVIPKGSPQAVYVSMEWTKRFRLTMTPSVLIFNSKGKLIWHRQGMLASPDVESAIQAIKIATQPGKG